MRPVFSLILALVTVVSLLFSSCGRSTPPPAASEVLTAMLEAAETTSQSIPDGIIRLTAAPSDSPSHLAETFFAALYGEAARGMLGDGATDGPPVGPPYGPPYGPPIQDGAIYLSVSPYPWELGVFRCADGDTAREVAALCRGRLDTLRRGFAGGEYEEAASGGRVAVKGNWVLLALCEDPAPLLEVARRLIP